MTRKKVDLVAILEAAYRIEPDARRWLEGVLDAARPGLDRGMGCSAFLYDASDVTHLHVHTFIGASSGHDDEGIMRAIERSTPERVTWTFRSQACRTASEGPDWEKQPAAKLFRKLGFEDVLFVNGVDPTGVGCFFTARLEKKQRLRARSSWSRVAAHLAAGHRLQRRFAAMEAGVRTDPSHDADAVLGTNGKVEHATGEATSNDALASLRRAVLAVDRARGSLRRRAPDEALSAWRGLVDARWSLVDHFDSDGRRYLVARRNEADVPEPERLTPRERQVLGYARLGHTNKLIAYELGISASTVGVLLSRAATKLGAKSRASLLAAFDRFTAHDARSSDE